MFHDTDAAASAAANTASAPTTDAAAKKAATPNQSKASLWSLCGTNKDTSAAHA